MLGTKDLRVDADVAREVIVTGFRIPKLDVVHWNPTPAARNLAGGRK